jgi:excisionase family DNA binding protein
MTRQLLTAGERLLTPAEAAGLLRVQVATIARWCTAGKLWHTVTPGGHRRVREADILAMLERAE